jgi:hypothetical protein
LSATGVAGISTPSASHVLGRKLDNVPFRAAVVYIIVAGLLPDYTNRDISLEHA